MSHPSPTHLRLEPRQTSLAASTGDEVTIPVGPDHLAVSIFRHEHLTAHELEQAIDVVEDALMATPMSHAERGELLTSNPLLRALPGLAQDGACLTLDQVETLLQRLASASLGHPGALAGLPAGGRAAAALLILRECMHHLGYGVVRIDSNA